MQKERPIQKQRSSKQCKNNGSPGCNHPFDRKLKIEKRHDGSRSQIRQKNVEVQAAVASHSFFLLRRLRVNKEENQRERENCIHPRSPEFTRVARSEIRVEDPGEGSHQRDVRLIAELRDLAQQTVLEKHQSESAPGHSDAGGPRLQFIPQ